MKVKPVQIGLYTAAVLHIELLKRYGFNCHQTDLAAHVEFYLNYLHGWVVSFGLYTFKS